MLDENVGNGTGKMNSKPEGAGARACWFVGATHGGTDDKTSRFLEEGIWEWNYGDTILREFWGHHT